jgi:hypothetical protein
MGILISQNPDTPEELESQPSVGICRIMVELPHSTELEHRKLHWTWMDSGRASTLKLLWGLPASWEVLRPSEPRLSLYSTKIEFGSPLGGGGAKPHFLHTFCRGEHYGIYRRSKAVLWPKIGHVRPTCQAGRPCNFIGRPSFLLAPPLGIGYLEHCLCWTRIQNGFWKCANTWLAGNTLARLSRALCHIISSCHIFYDYELFWT